MPGLGRSVRSRVEYQVPQVWNNMSGVSRLGWFIRCFVSYLRRYTLSSLQPYVRCEIVCYVSAGMSNVDWYVRHRMTCHVFNVTSDAGGLSGQSDMSVVEYSVRCEVGSQV